MVELQSTEIPVITAEPAGASGFVNELLLGSTSPDDDVGSTTSDAAIGAAVLKHELRSPMTWAVLVDVPLATLLSL